MKAWKPKKLGGNVYLRRLLPTFGKNSMIEILYKLSNIIVGEGFHALPFLVKT